VDALGCAVVCWCATKENVPKVYWLISKSRKLKHKKVRKVDALGCAVVCWCATKENVPKVCWLVELLVAQIVLQY
jgi:hypothetical protein